MGYKLLEVYKISKERYYDILLEKNEFRIWNTWMVH
jgi:hypothetical protein